MTTIPMPPPPCTPAKNETRTMAPSVQTPVYSSDLFKGQKTVVIEHNGTFYRLHSTKLGKLILTK